MPVYIVQYFSLTTAIFFLQCGQSAATDLPKPKFDTHPMLYYSSDDVEGLQLKALTTHGKIADILKDAAHKMLTNQEHYLPPKEYEKFGGRWNEIYGNNLPPLALHCVLFPEDREALAFAIKYMDAMMNLPKWQVIAIPDDEVPVAHSLTGFTTAFDMLYPHLDSTRRKTFAQRIVDETKAFYDFAKYRSWGKFYLQNHVATNYLALIQGSLVASLHYEPAKEWLSFAIEKFEKTMKLLEHVVDGSLDEGVAYGSYTSRSVTQYVFLALRHLDIDHTNSFWLKQHFWFYFNTILPKFKRTVGIADSNNNWFYGPESQLVFIDAYVLKNGHGNWLANEIRENRVRERDTKTLLAPAESQKWCTIHTEFIWFDATLGKATPLQSGKPNLHVFSDWGVVTYSRVSPKIDTDTFLAFKAGKVHGRGIFDVVQRNMYSSWVKGWSSFNPGHEHPDQNTFVFAPGGQLFITDRLYASKFSYLNNVWSFAPSPTSECLQPWEGQLGECSKWLGWRKPSASKYGAELVTVSYNNGMVFTSGEALDAYSGAMKLVSVYRSLLLVNAQMLVIVDHIETDSLSPLTHYSTFFHNFLTSFQPDTFKDHLSGVKLLTDAGDLRMFWVSDTGSSPKAELQMLPKEHKSQYQPGPTNYVNVTMEITRRTTRVAYVLLGHRAAAITDFEFVESTRHGAKIQLKSSRQTYEVSIATKHDDPVKRQQYLGYPGFASVKLRDDRVIKFGVNTTVPAEQRQANEANSKWFNTVNLSLGFTMSVCVALYLMKGRLHLKLHRRSKVILTTILLIWLLVMAQFAINCSRSSCFMLDQTPKRSFIGLGGTSEILPSVVITALPGSGAELIGWLFYNNPDVAYVQTPSDIIEPPRRTKFEMNPFVDACLWTYEDLGEYPQHRTWLQLLRQNLPTFISETGLDDERDRWSKRKLLKANRDKAVEPDVLYKEYTNKDLREHVGNYPNAQTVLHFTSGSWGLKLPWLHGILGNNLRAIHVIRDPRSWIATFLRNDQALYRTLNVQQAIDAMFLQVDTNCATSGRYATEYDNLRGRMGELKSSSSRHLLLAWLWSSNTQALLRTVTSLPESNSRLVRFEDLVGSAENTAGLIYKFIGRLDILKGWHGI